MNIQNIIIIAQVAFQLAPKKINSCYSGLHVGKNIPVADERMKGI